MGYHRGRQYTCIDFDKLFIGALRVGYDGRLSETHTQYCGREVKNKMVAFSINCPLANAKDDIETDCYMFVHPTYTESVFVTPEVRLSRDVIRNSGYKITRDPDKAEVVVIPATRETYLRYEFNVVVFDKHSKSLFLYSFNRKDSTRSEYSVKYDDDFDLVKEMFKDEEQYVLFQDKILDRAYATILPRYQGYKDLLLNTYPDRHYAMETKLRCLMPIEINIETLEIWRRSDDADMVQKSIAQSNWQDYPVTILCFLKNDCPSWFCDAPNNAFKLVLEQIGWQDRRYPLAALMQDRVIQPKDWNLLQSYLMYRLGVDEDGGYTKIDTYNKLTWYGPFFRKRFVVSPYKITTPQTFDNLMQAM